MLCAYNIQIFDVDTNDLVYELISTENQRAIQKNINLLTGYITNQENKINLLDTYKEEYNSSTLRTAFRTKLEKNYNELILNENSKYRKMKEIREKLKKRNCFRSSRD